MTTLDKANHAAPEPRPPELAGVVTINPLEDPAWDRKIAILPGATCFHTAAWARVLHDTYGYTPCYLATLGAGEFRSLFPMMGVASRLTGRRGVALPFTDMCAPLCAPGQDEQLLLAAAIGHAAEKSWRYIEFRGCNGIPPGAPVTVRYFIHKLCLRSGEDAVWSGLSGAARRAIRKASRADLTITTGGDEHALKEFFRLHCLTRKRLGVPPQPYAFFSNIRRHLLEHDLGTLFLASHRGKIIGAAIFLHFGTSVMFKFNASDAAFSNLRGNNLLMWDALRRFIAEGRQELHMGRNEIDNPGLRRYKLGWGTTEGELAYHRYVPARGGFESGRNPQQCWHHHAFRHIPVPLSRIIGTVVYPHMA